MRDKSGRFVKRQATVRVYNRYTQKYGTLVRQTGRGSLSKVRYDGMFFECWTWSERLIDVEI